MPTPLLADRHLEDSAIAIGAAGEERVHERLLTKLDRLVANTQRMIAVNRRLGFFTNGYNDLILLIPAGPKQTAVEPSAVPAPIGQHQPRRCRRQTTRVPSPAP